MSKLYVGNLPESTKEKDLRELFEAFGTVEEVAILQGYGFVHFVKSEDANAALAALDDSEFMGSHIQVQIARSKGHGYVHDGGPSRGKGLRGPAEVPRDEGHYHYEHPPVREFDRYAHYDYRGRYDCEEYDRYGYDYGRYPDYPVRSRSPQRDYYPLSRERLYYYDPRRAPLYPSPYRELYRDPYHDPYREPYRGAIRGVDRGYIVREYPRRW